MTQELKQELTSMVGPAAWEWLKPHASRDAILIVDPKLDLVEVGLALATDNVQSVQRWIGEALLTKPTSEQLQTWGSSKRFESLIIQPYVLVQDTANAG
ncbi:MAG: DUF2288 domain-containing protein [Leptolyngbya sp. SIO4C1]|nr:DUF2288 domain-containing protein [Leptolyngbya sp. SIO4C1]